MYFVLLATTVLFLAERGNTPLKSNKQALANCFKRICIRLQLVMPKEAKLPSW